MYLTSVNLILSGFFELASALSDLGPIAHVSVNVSVGCKRGDSSGISICSSIVIFLSSSSKSPAGNRKSTRHGLRDS